MANGAKLLCLVWVGVVIISGTTAQSRSKPSRSGKGKDDLKNEIDKLWREVNSLKEMQALQTVCLKGTKIHKKCYLSSKSPKSYHAANEDCIAQGGTLTIPRSSDEGNSLRSYAKKTLNGAGDIWIGVNDMTTEGKFVDVNGLPLTYFNWDRNEPRGGTRENCVVASISSQGKWSAEVCRTEKRYICEYLIP
ncbi:tetranectin-like protein [Scyliorhinus canicula]|uniref:tetranectin-like protein n=1 Tax=Scyliorhinus canicula TaxID=7830 RepID=UPI0018F40DEA|nr:tetranectin-like protein [Scyliorhinus canicula]